MELLCGLSISKTPGWIHTWDMNKPKYKTAVIDCGGAIRGVYGAGVLDQAMDDEVVFDYCLGISAGAGNLVSYVSKCPGRNLDFYLDTAARSEYMNPRHLLHHKPFIDLDYVYSEKTDKEGINRIVQQRIRQSSSQFYIYATNALSGQSVRFDKDRIDKDQYEVFKASCAVPYLCHPGIVGNVPFFDGTISNPIPVQDALDLGADKIVVITTGMDGMEKDPAWLKAGLPLLKRKYPKAAASLKQRTEKCRQAMKLMEQLEKEGRLLLLTPKTTFGVRAFSQGSEGILDLYEEGREDGKAIESFLEASIQTT